VLGAFEELVLLALIRQGEAAYAVSIRRDLVKRTGTEVAMGAVYATLDRLEEKGLIRRRESASEEGRRGRPRRYFAVSRAGIRALSRTHSVRDLMWQGIDLAAAGSRGDRV
jgi:PadR family transcriptional regulator PadR